MVKRKKKKKNTAPGAIKLTNGQPINQLRSFSNDERHLKIYAYAVVTTLRLSHWPRTLQCWRSMLQLV